jgi:tetratricopeptide (TPR) repeat protein
MSSLEVKTLSDKKINLNELDPHYVRGKMRLGLIYLLQSKHDAAFAEWQNEQDPFWRLFEQALGYHAIGKKKEAEAALAEIIDQYSDNSGFQIAEIYSYWGDKDKAFEWLERAYLLRDTGLGRMKRDILLRGLKDDPRYNVFLRKMNLPVN